MKHRSVFTKVGLVFAAVYALYNIVFFVYMVDETYRKADAESFELASNYSKLGQVLLRSGEAVDLSERLSTAIKNHQIDYFLIRKGGKDLVYGNPVGINDPIDFVTDGPEGKYETASYRHFLTRENGYELIIGHKTSRSYFLAGFFETHRSILLKDFCFVCLLVIVIVLFSFRDLRALIQQLTKRSIKRSSTVKAK